MVDSGGMSNSNKCLYCFGDHDGCTASTPRCSASRGSRPEDFTVANYCKAFRRSGLSPADFATKMVVSNPDRCLNVLDIVGMSPSSEPEIRALQVAI